ncbi:DNA-binding protein [Mycolicibacterium insubricum]|uniref:DNA-binding protein n=1 Tax=Mycolicibacterium insubricum TaxID=444597 RepID=A0A1X0DEB2_9MYCO|nr:OB-fold nucleic acid binding domain-containing protein [Mycolicibacterium insubricum]MCB9438925.1 OB-fold domain-containing protein [Mycolicibacterium sp.]MCV7083652.1 OB-fold domain-containing protein [Mycolicibacterium insubricum]ORA70529.1 DNA-binding protein [Mycolicibacterium insubricum]BBZ68880.1 DNA-binding protein [Mycolicibacterium insubricum]
MNASAANPAQIDGHQPPLTAPLKLSFDYTRSVGPVLGAFFTALRSRRIVGTRGSDGRVFVPPAEYDPVTYQPLTEVVEVSPVGTVVSWSWQSEPLDGQPLDRPFAWALIRLDGADTAMLHAVDVAEGALRTGDRVHAHWVDAPVGAITDIAYFSPGEDAEPAAEADDRDPVRMLVVPSHIEIEHSASHPEGVFLRALQQGKLLGGRTKVGRDGKPGPVYFPPKEADPATGMELDEFVELPDRGTVTTFAIINIPFPGQRIKPPYVAAYVLLDGADIPFLHLVTEIDAAEVRMGMRVQAVWKPREEWGLGIDNISHFKPSGEPDADYDTYKHHL